MRIQFRSFFAMPVCPLPCKLCSYNANNDQGSHSLRRGGERKKSRQDEEWASWTSHGREEEVQGSKRQLLGAFVRNLTEGRLRNFAELLLIADPTIQRSNHGG